MISDKRVEDALEYQIRTAKHYGEICGLVELRAHNIKTFRALAFLETEGTVAERDAVAQTDTRVKNAITEYQNAVAERMEIRTLLKAGELAIEVWRTQSASNRAKML